MKTARFATIVERCGPPALHVLWQAPERDTTLQSALKNNRVMTVHQETRGTKKDYGVVGFTGDAQAQLLIFPKSLQRFAGTRVVGISYDLLAKETPSTTVPVSLEKPRGRKRKPAQEQEDVVESFPSRGEDKQDDKIIARFSDEPTAPAYAPREDKTERSTPASQRHKHSGDVQSQTAAVSAGSPSRLAREKLLKEIEKTLKELKAGKAVAAYERLQALAKELQQAE